MEECCPKFNPKEWDFRRIVWKDKLFVKSHVTSFFHIPLNFGGIMKNSMKKIEISLAKDPEMLVLSDETSFWGTDIFISVTDKVSKMEMTKLSGVFLTRVFEGSFKNMGKWIKEMKTYVKTQGQSLEKLYFWRTTCPKCSKKYGVNYVVIFAKV